MRAIWNGGGFCLVGIGTLGFFVPGLPATVFFILALYCFTKGANEVWRERLLNHKVVGSTLRHWEEHRSISRRIKWVSCLAIFVSVGFSVAVIPVLWVKGLVLAVGIAGIAYILTRKTTEDLRLGEFERLVA
jgi:uncharacterized protein